MKPELHHLVHIDIVETMEYYEREGGTELAVDFFREFERVVAIVCERPLSFSSLSRDLRRAQFDRFPFHLLFSVEANHVFILVVRHDRRHPDFGLDR